MFSFKDHIEEIRTVRDAHNSVEGGHKIDLGIAYDMFRADVRNGENCNCSPALADFDFAAARMQWDAMTEDEQNAAYAEWHNREQA